MGTIVSCLACNAASCCVSTTCSMFGRSLACTKSRATRGLYVFQFIFVSVVAYFFSTYAYEWLEKVPVLSECTTSAAENSCFGALAVFRILFGLTVYHLVHALFLIQVQHSRDWRAGINDGWFPVKFLALVAIIVGAFYIPNKFFAGFGGWVMMIGAGFFIIIQLLLLIGFAYSWNESWLNKMEDEETDGKNTYYYMLLAATFLMIGASIALTGVMYHLFGRSGCNLNIFFITFNLILGVVYCLLAIHPQVREARPTSGLLQSAVMFLYTTYLVWSALMSSPADDTHPCNPFNSYSHGSKAFSLILGAMFTIVSVVYATFRAGSSSDQLLGAGSAADDNVEKQALTPSDKANESEEEKIPDDESEGVAYNYSFFHLAFAMGAMYICMLLTNWMTLKGLTGAPSDASGSDENKFRVDSGTGSLWIKMTSSWVVILLYVWTLLGPKLLPNRDWN